MQCPCQILHWQNYCSARHTLNTWPRFPKYCPMQHIKHAQCRKSPLIIICCCKQLCSNNLNPSHLHHELCMHGWTEHMPSATAHLDYQRPTPYVLLSVRPMPQRQEEVGIGQTQCFDYWSKCWKIKDKMVCFSARVLMLQPLVLLLSRLCVASLSKPIQYENQGCVSTGSCGIVIP